MASPSVHSGPAQPTRVLCVDDNPDMTAAMRMLIDTEPRMECVGCLSSADRLVHELRRLRPDVVLLDATMPGKDPLQAISEIAAEFPAIRTIVLSGHDDPAFIERAGSAGARGCLSKRDEPGTILRAVREVAAGNAWWPRAPHKG